MTLREVANQACDIYSAEAEVPSMGYTPQCDGLSPGDIAVEALAKEHGFTFSQVQEMIVTLCYEEGEALQQQWEREHAQ